MKNLEFFFTCGQIVNMVSELKSVICVVNDGKSWSSLIYGGGDINSALDQNRLGHKADGIFVPPVQNVPNVESNSI